MHGQAAEGFWVRDAVVQAVHERVERPDMDEPVGGVEVQLAPNRHDGDPGEELECLGGRRREFGVGNVRDLAGRPEPHHDALEERRHEDASRPVHGVVQHVLGGRVRAGRELALRPLRDEQAVVEVEIIGERDGRVDCHPRRDPRPAEPPCGRLHVVRERRVRRRRHGEPHQVRAPDERAQRQRVHDRPRQSDERRQARGAGSLRGVHVRRGGPEQRAGVHARQPAQHAQGHGNARSPAPSAVHEHEHGAEHEHGLRQEGTCPRTARADSARGA